MSEKEEKIKQLFSQGKSRKEIAEELKCCRSLISYHLDPKVKLRKAEKRNKNRKECKESRGAKCQFCGYSKCQKALHFHHIDPTTKKFGISDAICSAYSKEEIEAEIKKCVLICANCHIETHDGLINIEEFGAKDKI